LFIFEKAIKNASPVIEVKARRVGGSTYQVPVEVSDFEQQIYLYAGLLDMQNNGLVEVCR